MGATNAAAVQPAATVTGLAMGPVVLRVRDRGLVAGWYERVLGLAGSSLGGATMLGVPGGPTLFVLLGDSHARAPDPGATGLFHTAVLLPERGDLGRWLRHVMDIGQPLEGASDHAVSEAIYLSDPEGNGLEVYCDRPRAHWREEPEGVHMTTRRLAIDDLLAAAGGGTPWQAAPVGTSVGHVHLKVADVEPAAAFYRERVGLTLRAQRPGACFLAADGYHHHLAVNEWHSRGGRRPEPDRTGLVALTMQLPDEAALTALAARLDGAAAGRVVIASDPSGNRLLLVAGTPAIADLPAILTAGGGIA